ncbi:MAG: NAD-dependent epimerase/dehydratase family protein [Paracoccus sp. (in: a-proteobacteria)]|uniref:NAD-dependent epimerase/dehydratase family protein n=1 Tax=Paracoccus sp. TaxID=267 RepID=UPI0026DEBF5E|nr:NAD-dependent epimerase/dehydratase family protein [Paracoccus sp. (in: a-proteobacteria)]MDO5621283.1 NAD-dependent epimerase/dehydratase family protein [Paracoccus sp. (in: a-proteobacteria)]
MTEVIVTGASGFVGRALVMALAARGDRVHAVSRRAGADQPGVIWHQADLLTPEGRAALPDAPVLIHCAWQVEHGAFWTSPENEVWRLASGDLIRRFLGRGGRRVMVLGTCAEYDAQADGPWDEGRPIAPATPYGAAKVGLFDDLADIGAALIWPRLFHLYGPGEDARRLIPSLVLGLRQGRATEIRKAHLIRDFASTPYLARVLLALLDSQTSGAVDVGSGQPRSLGDLALILATAALHPERLRLSQQIDPAEPRLMAPRLTRLHTAIGPVSETPERALPQALNWSFS